MKSCKSKGLCCGAGGAQMFKESEKGTHEINEVRTLQIEEVKPDIVAAGCPFCNTMLTDGIKAKQKQDQIQVLDVAELIAKDLD
jgi:heterodisulfide reductase subunit D